MNMNVTDPNLRQALTYEVEIEEDGLVALRLPLPAGARAIIVVIPEAESPFDDLLQAAHSSLDFWDNPYDDEDWNGLPAG